MAYCSESPGLPQHLQSLLLSAHIVADLLLNQQVGCEAPPLPDRNQAAACPPLI